MAYLINTLRPNEIFGSSLKNWFDASQVNGLNVLLPADGNEIDTWINLATGGDNAVQTMAPRKPVFKTDIQNNKPAILFTRGTSTTEVDADFLALPSANGLALPYSVITVAKPRINNGDLCGIYAGGTYGGGNTITGYKYSLDYNGYSYPSSFRQTEYLSNTFICISVYRTNTERDAIKIGDGEFTYNENPALVGTTPNQLGARFDTNSPIAQWNSRNWDGWIMEAMSVNVDLALLENKDKLNHLMAYLKTKYEI